MLYDTRGKVRDDSTPQGWLRFARTFWLSACRASEKAKDSVRDPKNRADKTTYRIHWKEENIRSLWLKCIAAGKQELCDEYDINERQFRESKPFQIRNGGRDVCLCVYHLRWQLMVAGLSTARSTMIDSGAVKCKCDLSKYRNWHSLYRALICDRPEESNYQKRECIKRTCKDCHISLERDDPQNKKRVTGYSWPKLDTLICADEQQHNPEIKWERWEEIRYTRKDGSEGAKKDFVTVRTPLSELLQEMATFFEKFIQHHECAKYQDEDWQDLKYKLPCGCCVSVQDFAENYTHVDRQQHQSKYWTEVQSTVYPLVMRFQLDDLTNVSASEKEKLHKAFKEEGLPPIVTESHVSISSDMMHDTAFVHHVNDFLTEHYIKKYAPNVTRHFTRSDGCAGQYKNAHHFLWISKQKITTLIQRIWSFFCSCHGYVFPCCDCMPTTADVSVL